MPHSFLTEEEEMETDTRSSLGQSASETEEDTMSISKKEVGHGACLEGFCRDGVCVCAGFRPKHLAGLCLSQSPAAPGCTATYL